LGQLGVKVGALKLQHPTSAKSFLAAAVTRFTTGG